MASRASVRQLTSLLIAALDPGSSAAGLASLTTGLSPELIVGAAVNQRIDQVVVPRLADAGLEIPSDLLAPIGAARAKERLLIRRGMRSVAAALDDASIPWVVVKGPAIARHDPPDQQRPSTDLDVLVSLDRFVEALGVLAECGIVEGDADQWVSNVHHRLSEVDLVADGCTVDLHWDLVSLGARRKEIQIDTGAVLQRRRVAPFDGFDLPFPDATDTLLHVVIHAGLSGANHLRWFLDIQTLVTHDPPDWTEFVTRARNAGAAQMTGMVLERSRRVTGTGPPAEVTDALLGSLSRSFGPWFDRLPRDPTGPRDGVFAATPVAVARDRPLATVAALVDAGRTRIVDKLRDVVPAMGSTGTRDDYMAWIDDGAPLA